MNSVIRGNLNCGLLQYCPVFGDFRANYAKVDEILSAITSQDQAKYSFYVLPELAITGYAFENRDELAELAEEPKGPTFKLISEHARRLGAFIAYGYVERIDQFFYNSQNLVDPEGDLVVIYRKKNLFRSEIGLFSPGGGNYMVYSHRGLRIGMGICMDLNSRDFINFHATKESDLVLFSANWLDEGEPVQSYWRNRWRNMRAPLLISNIYGQQRNFQFAGNSCIIEHNQIQSVDSPKFEGVQQFSFSIV